MERQNEKITTNEMIKRVRHCCIKAIEENTLLDKYKNAVSVLTNVENTYITDVKKLHKYCREYGVPVKFVHDSESDKKYIVVNGKTVTSFDILSDAVLATVNGYLYFCREHATNNYYGALKGLNIRRVADLAKAEEEEEKIENKLEAIDAIAEVLNDFINICAQYDKSLESLAGMLEEVYSNFDPLIDDVASEYSVETADLYRLICADSAARCIRDKQKVKSERNLKSEPTIKDFSDKAIVNYMLADYSNERLGELIDEDLRV